MPEYTNKPMLAAEFIAACTEDQADDLTRSVHIRAQRYWGSEGGYTLERDNCAMKAWRLNLENQTHEIHWMHPYLVSPKGGARRFKTLDAAHSEAQRMAVAARASLEFTVSTRFYAHEHPIAA